MSANGLTYVRPVDGLQPGHAFMYTHDAQAVIGNCSQKGMLPVKEVHQLQNYADHTFALQHCSWVEDGPQEAILCKATAALTADQLILETTGVLWQSNLMPFMNRRDLFRQGEFSPPGCQWVAIAGLGLRSHELSLEALENLHTLASFRRPEGTLRPLLNVEIDGEAMLCASLPICTPQNYMPEDAEALGPDEFYDPNGVAAAYATGRNTAVTTDNLVKVSLAESKIKADEYEYRICSGSLVRQGQVVKVQLGFRIVERNGTFTMKTDLKALSILNEDIPQTIAFMSRGNIRSSKPRKILIHGAGASTVVRRHRYPSVYQKKGKFPEHDSTAMEDSDELPFASV